MVLLSSIVSQTLTAKRAAQLDQELMREGDGSFSLDQLMELAGLAVSQAVYREHPPNCGTNILVACGPGNNGGDGLVAARHLFHYGYQPTVFYPKPTNADIYLRLAQQLRHLSVPFTDDFDGALCHTSHVVDAIFGPVREPFRSVITALESTKVPVLAVDAPSSWNIETGPPMEGPGSSYHPTALISLTAPKPLVKYFRGTHFVGGRFLPPDLASKYELDVPQYFGIDQIVKVDVQ